MRPGHLFGSFILITIFLSSHIIPLSYSTDLQQFTECSHDFNCGSIQGIGFPFWGGDRPLSCGLQGFGLFCMDNQYLVIDIGRMRFRVLQIDRFIGKMRIAREDLWVGACLNEFTDTAISNYNHFNYARNVREIRIFYNCTSEVMSHVQIQSNITCSTNGRRSGVFFADTFVSTVNGCNISIVVPLLSTTFDELWNGTLTLQTALNQGFDVEYNADLAACLKCEASGGICGSDEYYRFVCLCLDNTNPEVCHNRGSKTNLRKKLAIGIGAALIGILSMCFIIYFIRKSSSDSSMAFWNRKTKDDKKIEAFIRQYGSLTTKRYKYSDVKKMTNSFKDKLGQGGYGSVYKGMLPNSRLVAVKVLNGSKGNGEEFVNEVASIGRTSHVNVVTLLGFCYESKNRALIYEFMPNGSLEKFIYHESPVKTDQQLGWDKLYQIALGIARGLEYLHRGCNTCILHLDIKPHNILLDEDFCPKISDFGLAKLHTKKESIVSMLGARGTIGYIAPEVFSRNFGGVSHKSDVYSYGMMVLEIVGGRKNVDAGVAHTSEIYFPHWIYRRLESDEDLRLQGQMTKEEDEIARKMILVGLWCKQTCPSARPPVNKVIEMLDGNIEALQIPLMPLLSSPPRSPVDSSTILHQDA